MSNDSSIWIIALVNFLTDKRTQNTGYSYKLTTRNIFWKVTVKKLFFVFCIVIFFRLFSYYLLFTYFNYYPQWFTYQSGIVSISVSNDTSTWISYIHGISVKLKKTIHINPKILVFLNLINPFLYKLRINKC